MKRKDLIKQEYNTWIKNRRKPLPDLDDLEIEFYKESKYLRGFWCEFEKQFNDLYSTIDGDPSLYNDSDFSKKTLMREMFIWIVEFLKLHFYTIYKDYEAQYRMVPWLDENGKKSYTPKGKLSKIRTEVGRTQLEDYVVQEPTIRTTVSEYFTVPRLLVAILKKNKLLLKEEVGKAKRHRLVENDPQMQRYIEIMKKLAQAENMHIKPNLADIVRKIEDKEKGRFRGNLYDSFQRWKKRNREEYEQYLKKFREELND